MSKTLKTQLNPFERWMVEQNVNRAKELGREAVVATLKANGYPRIAAAVEKWLIEAEAGPLQKVQAECACNTCGEKLYPGDSAHGIEDTDKSMVWTCSLCIEEGLFTSVKRYLKAEPSSARATP